MPNLQNISHPILIIGSRRSGTSWLLETIGKHPQVQAVPEHQILDVLYKGLVETWWYQNYCQNYSTPSDHETRMITVMKTTILELFPGIEPHWVMKSVRNNPPATLLPKLFPNARFIHACRSPLTAIPSTTEFLGDNPDHSTIEFAERQFIDLHTRALEIQKQGFPYLRIYQEDIKNAPSEVWKSIQDFCNLDFVHLPLTELSQEISVAQSMQGKVKLGRLPLSWEELSQETITISRELGYDSPLDIEITKDSPEIRLELQDYQVQCETLGSQKRNLETQVQYLNEKVKKAESDWSESQEWIEKLQQGKTWLEGELSRSVSYAQSLEEELARSQSESQSLQQELESIKTSKFWKLRTLWCKIQQDIGFSR